MDFKIPSLTITYSGQPCGCEGFDWSFNYYNLELEGWEWSRCSEHAEVHGGVAHIMEGSYPNLFPRIVGETDWKYNSYQYSLFDANGNQILSVSRDVFDMTLGAVQVFGSFVKVDEDELKKIEEIFIKILEKIPVKLHKRGNEEFGVELWNERRGEFPYLDYTPMQDIRGKRVFFKKIPVNKYKEEVKRIDRIRDETGIKYRVSPAVLQGEIVDSREETVEEFFPELRR